MVRSGISQVNALFAQRFSFSEVGIDQKTYKVMQATPDKGCSRVCSGYPQSGAQWLWATV